MKRIILMVLISTFAMSGFFNENQIIQEQKEKSEALRLCTIYTKKVEHYKDTMRNDDLAEVTLNNYERIKSDYCGESHNL